MTTQPEDYNWDESALLDDISFKKSDAEDFHGFLTNDNAENDHQVPTPGSILTGQIVEITKDFVVVDVGLKSEGLIPITEFSDTTVITLENQIEVLLDNAEDRNGQIVLSREKAERQRQWEYILEHCEEGSIVNGKIIRKVKGGLMVDIGM